MKYYLVSLPAGPMTAHGYLMTADEDRREAERFAHCMLSEVKRFVHCTLSEVEEQINDRLWAPMILMTPLDAEGKKIIHDVLDGLSTEGKEAAARMLSTKRHLELIFMVAAGIPEDDRLMAIH